jgi:phage/plasmid-like protein (TIGR03299 family)
MDWSIHEAAAQFAGLQGALCTAPDRKILYRSDNGAYLSDVGSGYNVVQPKQVLEFFRDLVADQGFALETAGCLFDGRKFWALARTGQQTRLRGVDPVSGYLLLATACDGSMATTAQFTSVRVVCNNTLQLSLRDRTSGAGAPHRDSGSGAGKVSVKHRSVFRANEVKRDLGLDVWASFEDQAESLVATPFSRHDKNAMKDFLVAVFQGDPDAELAEQPNKRAMMATFESLCNSPGAGLPTAVDTAWGALNAVTHYVDHVRPTRGGNAANNRFDAAQFGIGAQIKQRALDHLLKIAA